LDPFKSFFHLASLSNTSLRASETELAHSPGSVWDNKKSRIPAGPLSGTRLERNDVILKVSNLKT
jgi:hypothetical protein